MRKMILSKLMDAMADMMVTTSLSSQSSSTFHTSLPSESIVFPCGSNEQ